MADQLLIDQARSLAENLDEFRDLCVERGGSDPTKGQSVMAELSEAEHRMYHEEVSLTGCGVAGCTWIDGIVMHEGGTVVSDASPNCDAGYAHSDPLWPERTQP